MHILELSPTLAKSHPVCAQMAKTPVTNDQYSQCVAAGACTEPSLRAELPASFSYDTWGNTGAGIWKLLPCLCRRGHGRCPDDAPIYDTWGHPDRGEHPVVCVTVDQAKAFASWVGGRLPTEAEWERAARWLPCDTCMLPTLSTVRHTSPTELHPMLMVSFLRRHRYASSNVEYPTASEAAIGLDNLTMEVCSYPMSASGLCDTIGNVYEWTFDGFASYAAHPADGAPQSLALPSEHVVRGGSWLNEARSVSSTSRASASGGSGYYWLGFRPIRPLVHTAATTPALHKLDPTPLFPLLPTEGRSEHIVFQPYGLNTTHNLYRIPSVMATPSGAVLVVAEGRFNDNDWNEGSITLARSPDGGGTWEPERDLVMQTGKCANTPAMLLDSGRGRVHLFFALSDARRWHMPVGWYEDYSDAELHIMSSDDDGMHWTTPKSLNGIRAKPGPGHGIQLIWGQHAGRLLMPLRKDGLVGKERLSERIGSFEKTGPPNDGLTGLLTAYSDDGGAVWVVSPVVPNSAANEVQVFQQTSGTIGALVRGVCTSEPYNAPYKRGRPVHWSHDGGATWTPRQEANLSVALLDASTACSLLSIPMGDDNAQLILYSSPPMAAKHCGDHIARRHLTVRGSDDGGVTWPYALVIQSGPSAYSDMSLDRDGHTVHLAYERGEHRFDEEIVHTTFTLTDLMASRITPAAAFTFEAADVGPDPPPSRCSQELDAWCRSNVSHVGEQALARWDLSEQDPTRRWRCYMPSTLSDDRIRYENGSQYWTRDTELRTALGVCLSAAPQPLSPPSSPSQMFAHAGGRALPRDTHALLF